MCRVFMMNVKGHDRSEDSHALRMTPRPLTDVNGDQRKRLFHFMSLTSYMMSLSGQQGAAPPLQVVEDRR